MRLKQGKKYETADGTVFKVRKNPEYTHIWDVSEDTEDYWSEDGTGAYTSLNLIRRHYTKPQPAHNLDLNPGDVVELVAWEDGVTIFIGVLFTFNAEKLENIGGYFISVPSSLPKGKRPLFRVVSRA